MTSPGARPALLALAASLLAGVASAQLPIDTGPRSSRGLRDPTKKPQTSAKFDDGVRKFNGDDPESRLEALRIFAEVNDAKALEYLLQGANDPDTRIRIKAIDTLGNIRAKDATPFLVQQIFLRDTDLATKQRILAALGKIGDMRATKPILDFLSRDMDPAIRGNAIFALGDIGDPAALPGLKAIARDGHGDMMQRVAVEAIRKIEERPAPPVVVPALAGERHPGEGGGQP